MNYRKSEREKALRIRYDFFKDPGNDEHLKMKYPFVLKNSEKNLWNKIRKEAIKYFNDNKIVWWPGGDQPSGHLLSSQVSCVNHLFFLRNDKDAALRILQNINPNFVEVCPDFEDGYIGFEIVSKHSYLYEIAKGKEQTHGANCTSIDAMITGILKNDKKIKIFIEWKYTEFYPKPDKSEGSSDATRKNRYDTLIDDKDSPIKRMVSIDNFYYEPFYQILQQTLLACQMKKNKTYELKADDWLHFDMIPENNLNLRYLVPTPDMLQSGIEEAWKSQLKEPFKYNVIAPQKLLKPILFEARYRNLINYLNYRYW